MLHSQSNSLNIITAIDININYCNYCNHNTWTDVKWTYVEWIFAKLKTLDQTFIRSLPLVIRPPTVHFAKVTKLTDTLHLTSDTNPFFFRKPL